MSIENIIDWVIRIAILIGAWLWTSLLSRVAKLEDKHCDLDKSVIKNYVRKEDYQRSSDRLYTAIEGMRKEIKADLAAINSKLDTKADKK